MLFHRVQADHKGKHLWVEIAKKNVAVIKMHELLGFKYDFSTKITKGTETLELCYYDWVGKQKHTAPNRWDDQGTYIEEGGISNG